MTDRQLRVAVWTGSRENTFVDIFSAALRAAGAEVIEVTSPASLNREVDVLHIHWPEQLFWAGGKGVSLILAILRNLLALKRLRRKGTIVVWMVHNLKPHDMSWRKTQLWNLYLFFLCRLVDGAMTLSPGTISLVRSSISGLKTKPFKAVWHPSYPKRSARTDREKYRNLLEIANNRRLLAFFGNLRPYKGVDELLAKFMTNASTDEYLLIAGQALDPEYSEMLRWAAASDHRIVIIDRHLSEDEFAGMHAAADFIILPFVASLHSGSLIHALSEQRPVLTPMRPFAASVQEQVGEGWVVTYQGELDIRKLSTLELPGGRPDLSSFSADRAGVETLSFYRSLSSFKAASPLSQTHL